MVKGMPPACDTPTAVSGRVCSIDIRQNEHISKARPTEGAFLWARNNPLQYFKPLLGRVNPPLCSQHPVSCCGYALCGAVSFSVRNGGFLVRQ